jgi:hypothetical protein
MSDKEVVSLQEETRNLVLVALSNYVQTTGKTPALVLLSREVFSHMSGENYDDLKEHHCLYAEDSRSNTTVEIGWEPKLEGRTYKIFSTDEVSLYVGDEKNGTASGTRD